MRVTRDLQSGVKVPWVRQPGCSASCFGVDPGEHGTDGGALPITQSERVTLRPARPSDLSAIAALHTTSRLSAYESFLAPDARRRLPDEVHQHWQDWFNESTSRRRLMLVALVGADRCGFGLVEERGRGAMLRALHVAPEMRGRGIGRQLHAALVDTCVRWGYRRLDLHVIVDNAEARDFYRSRGWLDTGTRGTHEIGGQRLSIARYVLDMAGQQ